MAPPSQAGRFKPRKPAKKIRPGGSTGTPIPVPTASSSAAAAARAGSEGRGGGGASSGRGGGERGGGRGRGGRGRGRHVIQQGSAFFTAAPEASRSASASGSRSGTSGSRAAAVNRRLQGAAGRGDVAAGGSLIKREKNDNATSEEVVGMLDETIGGLVPEKPGSGAAAKLLSGKGGGSGASAKQEEEPLPLPPPSAFEYDSDSSVEIERSRYPAGLVMPSKNPLTLPFPKAKFPPGVGVPFQPMVEATPDEAALAPPVSPFVSLASSADDLDEEKDSLFLLQFPTRLPPLPGTTPATMDGAPSRSSNNNNNNVTGETVDKTAEVATPPVRRDLFDNHLSTANSGRIGKFVVYASGKTVLLLRGEDGRDYSLNVTEGLSCSFRQQAVVIEHDTKEFIPIGDVCKTAVVTPDLSRS